MSAPAWEANADLVVVGSGVAGLTAALQAQALGMRVLVVTKGEAGDGSTHLAQGGVAVVLDEDSVGDAVTDGGTDSVPAHIADTLSAGGGLCDESAVASVIGDGPAAVRLLRERGARFDVGEDGLLARTREGGHSAFRVVHAGGDATGAEIQRALLAAAAAESVPMLTGHSAAELLHTAGGAVGGALVLDAAGVPGVVRAPAVLLATGGAGQLYRATTNPYGATADGLALALRAGATLADLEFVQFHPTVLYTGAGQSGRRPLVTEAVRGEGAVLLDHSGARVMDGVHPLGDLAPRDVVSAAITKRMAQTGAEHVYLDATHLGGAWFRRRFPTVHAACAVAGIDPATDAIPVTPAAHFSCGGIMSTVDGRTGLVGLYAAGEVARTGLHGANRLASNSLLEGLVMGARVASAVLADRASGLLGDIGTVEPVRPLAAAITDRPLLQRAMSEQAAIGRSGAGLAAAREELARAAIVRPLRTKQAVEDAALTLVADCQLLAAGAREETRGCHVRADAPDTADTWRRSLAVRLDVSGRPILIGAPARTLAEVA
jgi:L-aspartate oxidase